MGMFGKAGKKALNLAGIGLLGVDFERQKQLRAKQAAGSEAMQNLERLLAPKAQAYTGMAGPTMDGSEPTAQAIPQGMRQPTARDLRDPEVQRALMQAERYGKNPALAMKLFEANAPDIASNGQFNFDKRDPRNANRFFPKVGEDRMPLYDGNGNVVGVRNLDGSVQSAAEMAGAIEGAKEKAKAPYSFQTFQGPDGVSNVVTSATAARMGANGGVIARGQSRPDAIRAEGAATNDVAQSAALQGRAATAGRQLSALDNMERLLPDVISGFGSEALLQTARLSAKIGDKNAARRVAATETFLNQGRVLVADMIKSFGANPTEGERKYAERMSGADATLNPATLKEGIRLQRERINRDLQEAGRATQATAPPPAQRTRGQVYQTPRGPMEWTGTGWRPQ